MTPKKANVLFCVLLGVSLLTAGVLELGARFFASAPDLPAALILSQLSLVLPCLVFAMLTPGTLQEMFPLRRVKFRSLLLALVMMVALFPTVMLINVLTSLLSGNAATAVLQELPAWDPALMVILIGVFGPFCEEAVFRGYVYQSLRRGDRWKTAIFLSALFFGLMHMNWNQAAYATVLGIFFALLTRAAGSLWPAILAHMSLNSFEVLAMYSTAGDAQELASEAVLAEELAMIGDAMIYGAPVLLVLVLGGLALALLCVHRVEVLEDRIPPPEEENFVRLPTIGIFTVVGVVSAVFFMSWSQWLS